MRMRAVFLLAALLAPAACGRPEQTAAPAAAPTQAASAEPPMFRIDASAVGPLTMAELQIDLPEIIDARLNDSERACFFASVEQLIAAAGDPETLAPGDLDFFIPEEQWPDLTPRARRAILAQAILPHALERCLEGWKN